MIGVEEYRGRAGWRLGASDLHPPLLLIAIHRSASTTHRAATTCDISETEDYGEVHRSNSISVVRAVNKSRRGTVTQREWRKDLTSTLW